VKAVDKWAMSWAQEKIMSAVLLSCRSSPFTQV